MKNSFKQSPGKLLALGLSLVLGLTAVSSTQAAVLRKIYYITAGGSGSTPAVGDSLWVANDDGTGATKVVDATGFANPNAMALDMANNRAFVADSFGGQQAIYTVNLTTGATASFVSTLNMTVNGMEVDAANGFLYYVTGNAAGGASATSGDSLWRVALNGTGNTQIFDANTLINPNAMALDLANNRAFVADNFAGVQAIYTVNLTTGAIATFLTKTNLTTSGMRVDPVNGKLYYITAATGNPGVGDSLWKVNLNGTSDTVIQDNTTISNPNALEIDVPGNRAIVADSFAGNQNLYSINLTTGAVTSFITVGLTSRGVQLVPVTVTTQAATTVGSTGATLNGLINAQGGSTQNVTFEYGTTTAYGSTGTSTPATVSGAADTAVSSTIAGLTAGTLYHYRVKTQSGVGADMTFTTSAAVSAAGVLALGAPASNQLSSSLAYTVPAGTNRLLVVYLAQDLVPTIPAPTFNGSAMTLGVHKDDGSIAGDSIFYMKLGDGGAITSTITATANAAFIGASAYTNVDQTTPVSSPASFNNTSGGSSPGITVTSATGDLVVDLVDVYQATAETPGGGQTVVHSQQIPSHSAFYKTSTKPGAATVNMSWTSTGGTSIIHAALNIKSRPAFTAPTVATAAATSVLTTTATLNGTINPQGVNAVSSFDYGTTVGYGSVAYGVPVVVVGSGNLAVSADLTGLAPGTTYHYRANAINGTTVNGSDMTFTTASASPTVTNTTTAILATATTVTITGTNFDAATPGNNTVVFSPAGTGTVTAATATSLTVTGVTGLRGGQLKAVVTNGSGNSGAAVQVASVAPVITVNTANITTLANQLTINGVGFDPVAFGNNSVVFSPAGTGNVVGSTAGSVNVTGISGLTAGALNAVVTVNGVASASAQVATVISPPNLTINDVTLSEGNSGTTSFIFTVSLSSPAPTGGVTFDIATQDSTATTADSDYVAKSFTSQTIAAGQQTYSFTVLVNGDTKYEPNEAFFVNVTNVTNAAVTDGVGMGTINNDDAQPTVSFLNNPSGAEGNGGTNSYTFIIILSNPSSLPVNVLATSFDGTATTADNDYVANSQVMTIPAGSTFVNFSVTQNGDTKGEGDETFFVRLTLPVNATLGAANVSQATITNDDVSTGKNYVVTTNADTVWSSLDITNGKINGTNTVTLRSAVIAANQSGAGPHTISIPVNVGVCTLSNNNPGPVGTTWANATPDLNIGSNFSTIIIQGVGGNAQIVQGVAGYDVLTTGIKSDGFTPAIVNLSLDHLDISGGGFTGIFVGADDGLNNSNSRSRTQITNCNIHNNSNADGVFGQGGAIQNGAGYLTVSDTIFSNNSASNAATGQGGAIWYSLPNGAGTQGVVGDLSVTNCTFTNNSASKSGGLGGGAIYAEIASTTGNNLVIKNNTFTTNSSAADGGAVVVSSGRTVDIMYNNFVSNSVSGSGHGGAVAVNTGIANINYNRFISNTAATATNGKTLYRPVSATGTTNANTNWWGVNSGPVVNDIVGTFTSGININLKLVPSPSSVPLLGTSALTADFFTASNASAVSLANLKALIGLPAAYGAPLTLGTLSNSDTFLHADGMALSTYNAGATPGSGTASVTVDSQTVTANITVGNSGAASSLASLSASAGALSPAFTSGNIGPYAVSALNATTTTTITPTATNGSATLSYNVNGGGFTAIASGATSAPISLNAAGVNTPIIVKVVSQDTTTTTQYTINVTRAASGIGAPVTVFTSGVDSPPGAPGTTFASVRSGMALASSGALTFRGYLTIGGTVDANNYMGMWKSSDGSAANVALVARSGSAAPNTTSALFDILPLNGVINNAAQVTFPSFTRVGTGTPTTTTSNDGGVWSELGTGGLKLLLREGTSITGGTVTNVAPTTWVATGANVSAFTVQFASGSALVRGTFTGGTTPAITTLATEGGAAPGGGTFDSFAGNSADPRVDATDDVAFLGYLQTSGIPGIWYQSAAGSLVLAVKGGQTTAGLTDTYSAFERPSLGNATSVAFRAFLTTNGQSVFRGNPSTPASILPLAVTGYTSAQIATIPAGRKLWSIWSPFSNATGHVAFRASLVDTAGNTNENRAILTDTSGTLAVIAKVGDTAPGVGAETFANFDHPVIGDGDQTAFVASTSAGTVGVWRQSAGGGALLLVLKVGDTLTINAVPETVASINIPGSSSDDRKYETKCIDSAGHVLLHVTYVSGKTGIVLSAP